MRKIISIFISVLMGLGVIAGVSFASFSDVDEGQFYYTSIDYLQSVGIVEGYDDGTFGYSRSINRAELLKIVMEAGLAEDGLSVLDPYVSESCFEDVPANEWYTKYICYAKKEGWIEGYSDGTYQPDRYISFVEALKIVLEANNIVYDETDIWYQGLVEEGADQNIIPFTISRFDHEISRAEMAEMVVRRVKYDKGVLDAFLGNLADVNVTYETILNGENLAVGLNEPVGRCTGWDLCEDGVIVYISDFGYNVVDEIYTGFTYINREFDLSENDDFQALFPTGMYYITGDGGVLDGVKIYFTTLEIGGDVAVMNKVMEYDSAYETIEEVFSYEDVFGNGYIMLGIDTENDLAVVYKDPTPLDLPGDPWECWMPYYPWAYMDLYSVKLDGTSTEFEEYEASDLLIEWAEDQYDTCMEV